ncbi:MAG: hypothetical protein R3C49_16355 [Planctomycetaceae bacterium]
MKMKFLATGLLLAVVFAATSAAEAGQRHRRSVEGPNCGPPGPPVYSYPAYPAYPVPAPVQYCPAPMEYQMASSIIMPAEPQETLKPLVVQETITISKQVPSMAIGPDGKEIRVYQSVTEKKVVTKTLTAATQQINHLRKKL